MPRLQRIVALRGLEPGVRAIPGMVLGVKGNVRHTQRNVRNSDYAEMLNKYKDR